MAQTPTGVTRSNLGIGRTRDTSNRHYTSAPDNSPSDFSVQEERPTTIVETSMKRKEIILTPDNADSVLSTSFDIKAFFQRLSGNRALVEDQQALFEILKGCVIDNEIVAFNDVAERHLAVLGLDFSYTLELDKERAEAANDRNSFPNSYLNQHSSQDFLKHFDMSKEKGRRCAIGQYLLAAVVYAQSTIDSDENLKNKLSGDFQIHDPHVAIFTTPQVPHTRVSSDGTSYVFHGSFDYGMGFIESRDVASLARGSLGISVSKMSSGVVEAKTLADMVPQITVQVLTVLALTGRQSFTSVLTNGALWRFFTAYDGGDQIRIYRSPEFTSNADTGLIIELLKDMILYPVSPMIVTDLNKVSG